MEGIRVIGRLLQRVRNSVRWRLGFRPLYERPMPEALAAFQRRRGLIAQPERLLRNGIAVVVPVFGHEPYLESAVASLARQTYRPFHVVFVEDRSPDGSLELLRRLAPQLPKGIAATVLRTPRNSGQAAAINLAVRARRASLYVVLNDDDYLMHDCLEANLAMFEKMPDIYLLGAGCVPFSGAGEPPADEAGRRIRSRFPDYGAIPVRRIEAAEAQRFTHPNDFNVTHSGSCFHRAAWESAGGYYPDPWKRVVRFSDRDFQLRVAVLLPCAATMDAPFAFWREGSSVDAGKNS